jgi:hypothetical protein
MLTSLRKSLVIGNRASMRESSEFAAVLAWLKASREAIEPEPIEFFGGREACAEMRRLFSLAHAHACKGEVDDSAATDLTATPPAGLPHPPPSHPRLSHISPFPRK